MVHNLVYGEPAHVVKLGRSSPQMVHVNIPSTLEESLLIGEELVKSSKGLLTSRLIDRIDRWQVNLLYYIDVF